MPKKTPSFYVTIHVPPLGGRRTKTVHINKGSCAERDIDVGSRPAADGTRDYFVTCKGREPEECHMIIRSRAPARKDSPFPRGGMIFCKGSCEEGYVCKECDFQLDANTAATTCQCIPKYLIKLALKEAIPKKVKGNVGRTRREDQIANLEK